MPPLGFQDKIAFVWRVADKLRGTFKQHEYGSVMLPLLVLRRMDQVLAPTKDAVVAQAHGLVEVTPGMDARLKQTAKQRFYNTSPLTFQTLLNDDKNLADNLAAYIRKLSPDAYAVIEAYNFDDKITRMDRAGILYQVMADFADLDLRPSVVSNEAMGYIFEELLRKFSEMSNETAGEHYTPREVIRLVADLLVKGRAAQELTDAERPVRTIYDPAAGTGGMLMVGMQRIKDLNPGATVMVAGQELNDETWAIAQSDLMMQDIDPRRMRNGNTLTADAFPTEKFDFILANPPYGVDWKGYAKPIREEAEDLGFRGRFGAGLPRVSDGSLLFLQHMLSHMKPNGSRVGIVLSGSPLFSGQAGSGESEIRRWILENDWLEGIVALPDQMFYNTGISTYIWILSNKKPDDRKGWTQLIDASSFWQKMRKSLGSKRKELSDAHIADITRLFGEFAEAELATVLDAAGKEIERQVLLSGQTRPAAPAGGKLKVVPISRVFRNEEFGYTTLTIERPVRDAAGQVVLGSKGKHKGRPQADSALRDTENVPLGEDIQAYFEREVLPHAPDAWIEHEKSKVCYEIPFNRHFYVFEPPRSLHEIDEELKGVTANIMRMLEGLAE